MRLLPDLPASCRRTLLLLLFAVSCTFVPRRPGADPAGFSTAGWRLRNLENLLDDPVDDLKHRLHGMPFGDQRVFLPRAVMPVSVAPCP